MGDELTVRRVYGGEEMGKGRGEGTKVRKVVKMGFGNGGRKDGKRMCVDGREEGVKKEVVEKNID